MVGRRRVSVGAVKEVAAEGLTIEASVGVAGGEWTSETALGELITEMVAGESTT